MKKINILFIAILVFSALIPLVTIQERALAADTYSWNGTTIVNAYETCYYNTATAQNICTPLTREYTNPNPRPVTIDGKQYIAFTSTDTDALRIYIQPFDSTCVTGGGAGGVNYCYSGIGTTDLVRDKDGNTVANFAIGSVDKASASLNSVFNLIGCPGTTGTAQDTWSYSCIGGGEVINGTFVAADTDTAAEQADLTAREGCQTALWGIGWIFCQFIDIAEGIYKTFISSLYGLLFIGDDKLSGSALQESWANVRDVANALIVLIGLVIVASQIFNFKFLSAYTVKSALPRLIIAVIAIQLSWFIFTTLIDIVNALGVGVYQLLTFPFVSGGAGSTDIAWLFTQSSGGSQALLATLGIAGVGIGAALAVSGGATLSLLLALVGVVISILTAFVVLLIRQMVIIVLLILAPVALIAWVLPNTQIWWKKWWDLFLKLLLMFPLIMVLFAAGTIGANIISDITNMNGVLKAAAMLIVFFAPLFLVTKTFSYAGGMFNGVVNGVNKIGNKAKGSSYFGLKGQAKANKESVQAYKKSQAYQYLAQNQDAKGFKKLRARARTGTLPIMAPTRLGKDAREAASRRDQVAIQRGLQERLKEGDIENQTIDLQAGDYAAYWKNSGALAKDNRGTLVRNATGVFDSSEYHDGQVPKTIEEQRAARRAAMQELIKQGDAEGMQQVITAMERQLTPTFLATNEGQKISDEYNRMRASGEFAGAFMAKRSDWIKRNPSAATPALQPGPAFESFGAMELARFHASGKKSLNEYLADLKSTDPAAYETRVSLLGSNLAKMLDDPNTLSAASANSGAMAMYKSELETHMRDVASTGSVGARQGLDVLTDRIDSHGVILPPPNPTAGASGGPTGGSGTGPTTTPPPSRSPGPSRGPTAPSGSRTGVNYSGATPEDLANIANSHPNEEHRADALDELHRQGHHIDEDGTLHIGRDR